jgi:hypothetical protein
MLRSRICQIGAAVAGLVVLGAGLTAAPAQADVADAKSSSDRIPSFKEFKADTFKEKGGPWIVNGDEPVRTKKELKAYYRMMRGWDQSLIVNTVGGYLDAWDPSTANNLTYCVSTAFGSSYNTIVNAMNQGAALWENAANVNFTHVSTQDGNCWTGNNSVLFSVEPTSTNQYIARAFFPSSPDYQRNVLVNAVSLQNSGSWTPGNILGHELGHTLGFRHEHTRPEAGTCFEDNNWYALTPYDSVSIMHYPQCNGGSSDLRFSGYDAQGAAYLYGV